MHSVVCSLLVPRALQGYNGESTGVYRIVFCGLQAHADMLAMMYKTAALLPEGLVPTGLHPLMLLDACMGEGRPLAIVREGAAGVSALAVHPH